MVKNTQDLYVQGHFQIQNHHGQEQPCLSSGIENSRSLMEPHPARIAGSEVVVVKNNLAFRVGQDQRTDTY